MDDYTYNGNNGDQNYPRVSPPGYGAPDDGSTPAPRYPSQYSAGYGSPDDGSYPQQSYPQQGYPQPGNVYDSTSLLAKAQPDLRVYLMGILGAVVGALPGMLAWVLVGKMGYVMAIIGAGLSLGIVFGFNFTTKNYDIPTWFTSVVCVAVFVGAILLSMRLVYTWQLTEMMHREFRDVMIEGVMEMGYSKSEAESYISEGMYKLLLKTSLGIEDDSFGTVFANFSSLLEVLEMKSAYYRDLAIGFVFGILGGAGAVSRRNKI